MWSLRSASGDVEYSMPIFYSLISRGHVVLCDHATAGVNLEVVALQALDQLGPSDVRRCQRHDENSVYTMVDNGLTYLCITDDKFSKVSHMIVSDFTVNVHVLTPP